MCPSVGNALRGVPRSSGTPRRAFPTNGEKQRNATEGVPYKWSVVHARPSGTRRIGRRLRRNAMGKGPKRRSLPVEGDDDAGDVVLRAALEGQLDEVIDPF